MGGDYLVEADEFVWAQRHQLGMSGPVCIRSCRRVGRGGDAACPRKQYTPVWESRGPMAQGSLLGDNAQEAVGVEVGDRGKT